jgi:hypothetical protein
MRPNPRRSVISAAALAWLLLGFSDFTERSVECEHTVAHLLQCCPDLTVDGACDHNTGCDSDRVPVFTVRESELLQERSCEDLQDECEELDEILQRNQETDDAF